MNTTIKTFLVSLGCLLALSCGSLSAQNKPLKVFVLVGQSNMQGHAKLKTLPHIGLDPKTKPILEQIQDESGQPRVFDDTWISYLSSNGVKTGQLTTGFGADENKIGPELTFGIYMQKRIGEPILIIKTAWGGKSIHTDFRPPSAGPFEFDDAAIARMTKQGKDIAAIKADRVKATGVYYRQTIDHVKKVLADIKKVYPDYDEKQGYELAGMAWFQGWNDMVASDVYPNRGKDGGYEQYTNVLRHLIRDFRKDLGAPELPFVVGVMGTGGPTEKYVPDQMRYKAIHQGFRDAMAAPAKEDEFKDNVVNVLTENYWDLELDALITRNNEIESRLKQFQKSGKHDAKAWERFAEEQQAKSLSKSEMKTLKTGVSNAAYHYLGCAKILTQIGKAFAEEMPLKDSNASPTKKNGE